MKRFILLAFTSIMMIGILSAASVKVKFTANTASISDTITATSKITITGNLAAITGWSDGIALTNIGGDYWSTEITFNSGDTIVYKYRANGGWENNLQDPYGIGGTPGNDLNRRFIVGTADTTLPVEFYNTGSTQPQYWRPYPATASDSLTVWVRVNMQAVMENKTFGWTDADKDSVVVMGDGYHRSADLDWGTSHYLTQESNPNFFSARIRIAKDSVSVGQVINYKYRLGNIWGRDELQGQPNRTFSIPVGKADTTIAFVYYNNDKPVIRENTDTCIITFNVDLAKSISAGGFQTGDTVVVQSGFFNTGAENGRQKQMNLIIGSKYTVTDTIVTKVGFLLDYQYYLVKNGATIRENYFNYNYGGTASSERERRQITVSSKQFSFTDFATSPSDPRRQPEFSSQKPLKQDVTVTWKVDLRPAYYKVKAGFTLQDDQDNTFIISSADSIKKYGVGINGPATNLPTVYPVGDWATWNRDMVADTSKRKMWDDGTHGDNVAGDSIFTTQFTYPAGATAGKVYKFGIRGGDNEAGNGQGFGNNHNANISDVNPTYTIYTEFGSNNPNYYSDVWTFSGLDPTGVAENSGSMPVKFALEQNYPNPFNPSTSISYSIPSRANVNLTIFNVVGQEVSTLVNENLEAGNHVVQFNASALASGVYFYKLSAGNFTSVKKMMLLK